MSYLIKALGTATHPKRVGETPKPDNWTAGMIDQVDEALIQWYQDHSDVFTVLGRNGASPSGLTSVTGLSAIDTFDGIVHQSVLTLTDVAQAVTNGTEYQGTKLFDFPAGNILVLGCVASIAQKTTSALASTLNAGSTGALSIGSAAASSTTLNGTMANFLTSTAFTSSATINVAGTVVGGVLAAPLNLDGTTTAADMYINTAYATTTDVDGNATQTLTGTITLTWLNLGDK